MITFLPAIIAVSAYLIWRSNRNAYDRHLIEQVKGNCVDARSILKKYQ